MVLSAFNMTVYIQFVKHKVFFIIKIFLGEYVKIS